MRLDSWKEIATYLKRDVRTVRRWETTEGLPVHRHLHRARPSVYAFSSEIDAWWDNAKRPLENEPVVPASSRRLATFARAAVVVSLAGAGSLMTLGDGVGRADGAGISRSDDGSSGRSRALSGASSRDPQAYELYLRGRELLNRRAGARRVAVPYLERAVARDPTFAAAQAALGEAYLRSAIRAEPAERRQAWADADGAIRRALALDDALAAGHTTLGWLYLFRDWNWPMARAELVRAIELDPNDPNVHSNYATYLRGAGRMDEAITERRLARAAEPLRIDLTVWLGTEYVFARRYAEAVEAFEQALEIEPAYVPALDGLADVLARKGLYEQAAAAQVRLFTVRGNADLATGFDAAYQRGGYPAAAAWLDRRSLDEFSRRPDVNAWNLAYTHARLGDHEAALHWLGIALEQRDSGLLQVRVDPDVDGLRADPRFQAIVARMGIWP